MSSSANSRPRVESPLRKCRVRTTNESKLPRDWEAFLAGSFSYISYNGRNTKIIKIALAATLEADDAIFCNTKLHTEEKNQRNHQKSDVFQFSPNDREKVIFFHTTHVNRDFIVKRSPQIQDVEKTNSLDAWTSIDVKKSR